MEADKGVKINQILKKQKSINLAVQKQIKQEEPLRKDQSHQMRVTQQKNVYNLKIKNLTKSQLKKFEVFLAQIKDQKTQQQN